MSYPGNHVELDLLRINYRT